MNKQIQRLFVYACLLIAGLAWTTKANAFTDFEAAINGVPSDLQGPSPFGIFVDAATGEVTYSAETEGATMVVAPARFNDSSHGFVNIVATIAVEGPVKVGLGNCQYGSQDGTITDSEGNTTSLTVGNANCYHQNTAENISYTLYKGTSPTTLTIKYNGYCPFISVSQVGAEDLVDDATVSFSEGDAQGVVPASVKGEVGSSITLPKNFTLYKEGYTLTGWSDGTDTYAVGGSYTIPSADITLTPVFTQNTVSLADRSEAVTLKFDFQRQNGAPTVSYQNQTGVWVAQATVNGQSIDVKADFDTNNGGKFANGNWSDWAQVNGGTTWTVPSCKGATISMEAYSEITTTTIDGQTDYTQGKTISYTIGGSAETVDVVIGDGSYYRYIQVVLPVVQQGQGGASFDNVAGTISWQVGNEANGTVSADIADAVQQATWTAGSAMTIATSTYFESTMVNYKPDESNAGNVEGVMVEYRVKLASGLTFKPSTVSYDCVKVGTDGATYSWGYVVDDQPGVVTDVDAATTLRNNGANSATAELNHTLDVSDAGEGNVFAIRFYISKTANNKNICIGNVIISGTVSGTATEVASYTLSVAASPAEGGTVSAYPAADAYDEGSEVTLTATENFGYDFVNWTNAEGEEVSTEARFKYTVNADAELTANFVAVETYELSLDVEGANSYMVTVSPEPTVVNGKNMYEAGVNVLISASQYEGLVIFNNWSDGTTNSEKTIPMTEDVTLTAVYSQADIIAGWDFYTSGGNGRKADYFAENNDAVALNLVNTETGAISGWLDKSTEAAGGYESFKGAATNWRAGESNGDVGHYHWQTKINAEAFTDINVQFQMMYNYNAYQTYNVEWSTDGESWNGAGSITMTGAKAAASFSGTLPAEANNQANLYIRMIADKTSKVDGTASANDGNTLAMFFITGTPKFADDGTAPVLVSTVPEDGATGASASGRIVLTFDERVKVADGASATLNGETLTPAVSGKTVTFDYKGLDYATAYTFSLPANSVADMGDNYISNPISLTFTTMVRPSVEKSLYDFIVPDDGSFTDGLTAAAARSDKSKRFRIFVKKGDYVIPANTSAMVTGTDGNQYADPKTSFGSPNVSIIGEDMAATTITNEMPNSLATNPDAGAGGQANPLEGIRTSGVLYLTSGAQNTYFQDIKLWSATADNTGRNVVLVDGGNKTICKNVCLWAYQDTYVSDNAHNFYYFEGGVLRGRTDFLCGSGDVFYNGVTLQMCEKGGYIAVPRDNVKYGYVFKDCTIKGDAGVDGNYYLGRPWTKGAEVYYIDTRMEAIPTAVGWHDMSADGCTRMAEYNSTTASGTVIDLSSRTTILGGNPNEPILTAEEAAEIGNLHNMFGDWDPTLATEQAPVPANVVLAGNELSWTGSDYALLYAICKDGNVIGFTTDESYTVDDLDGEYTVRAANEMGGLSESSAVAVTVPTSITLSTINAAEQGRQQVYNLNGQRVNRSYKGVVIINGTKQVQK